MWLHQLNLKFILLVLIVTLLPRMVDAQQEIKICGHPENYPEYYIDLEIKVVIDDHFADLNSQELVNGCHELSLQKCDETVGIYVESGLLKGFSTCRVEPAPMNIVMRAEKIQIVTSFITKTPLDNIDRFLSDRLIAEIDSAEHILPELPTEARSVNNLFYSALAVGDYPKAQQYANEMAEYLRNADQERASLAYSSITYLAGFDAMGKDSLNEQNPLVSAMGTNDTPFLVLSQTGQDVLIEYQEELNILSKPGVWDFNTSLAISENEIVDWATIGQE